MGLEFELPEGATPIDPDEAAGLIPSIATQSDLNTFEAINIGEAVNWAIGNKRFLRTLLTDDGLRRLHARMFNRTWKWAGVYRVTQKSIGVEAYRISVEVRNLLADVECWLQFSSYPPAEVAARFHHRLVEIHPFANGNGRHARLATDLLCESRVWPISKWGAANLVQDGEIRRRYIQALKSADGQDFAPLIEFMDLKFPHNQSVLICVAELHIARLFKAKLKREGYTVTCALGVDSAIEALSTAESSDGQRFDKAILDGTIPELGAYEVLDWIKSHEQTERTWVAVFNLGASDMELWNAKPYRADRYMVKGRDRFDLFH